MLSSTQQRCSYLTHPNRFNPTDLVKSYRAGAGYWTPHVDVFKLLSCHQHEVSSVSVKHEGLKFYNKKKYVLYYHLGDTGYYFGNRKQKTELQTTQSPSS